MAEVKIKNARLAFASIWEPKEQLNGSLKFEVNGIITRDNPAFKEVQAAMLSVGKELWKDRATEVIKNIDSKRKCLRDGNANTNKEGVPYSGFEGNFYIVAKSTSRPLVIDAARNPLVAADGKPYNGCYVTLLVDIYATNKKEQGGNGIFAELKGVQFTRDGDAFGGSSPARAEQFDVEETDAPASGAGNGFDEDDGLL